jgi:N-terminal domain of reverse transcriptase
MGTGRTRRNCQKKETRKCSIEQDRDSWELASWKGFQKLLFRLQKRIFKAVRDGDKANVRKLQRVSFPPMQLESWLSDK